MLVSCPLAAMSSWTANELPWILLSHNGRQKDFVRHLYHALLDAKHRPFFDECLPIGVFYPTLILKACQACKIGVVVLSEDYVETLWSMLELQHLLLNPADRLIYPLFYRLKPADLSNPANLERWGQCWKQNAPAWQSRIQELEEHIASSSNGSCRIQINLDIESWPDNLKRLQSRGGEVCNVFDVNPERSFYGSDYKYIQAIVDNICARFPPQAMEHLVEVGVVGEKRVQEEINQVFEQEGSMLVGSSFAAMSSWTADEVPWIFLSHSGQQQQRDFVTHLYHALQLRAKHRPFFDKDSEDSLPIDLDYHACPIHIFEACRACKIGVVVLSEQYVHSLWTMLELQHLLLRPGDRPIYPLFYDMKPADLSNRANLERWGQFWKQKAPAWQSRIQGLEEYIASSSNGSCRIQINLDIASWPHNLKMLQYRVGEVCQVFHERSFYVIVDKICARLPPPMENLLEVGVVGEKRMQQEINQVFEQEGSMGDDGVSVIGVYGNRGSGKSTLCKMMADFYRSKFLGIRSFFLEFPTLGEGEDDISTLLKSVKAILIRLGYGKTDRISHIDQVFCILEEGLRNKKVFLAIDNVRNATSFEYARRIMLMKFMAGTQIMITSRSKEIVSLLLQSRPGRMNDGEQNIVHVPSISEAEAVEILKHNSQTLRRIPEENLKKLARSCCVEGQYHPSRLKLKAAEQDLIGQENRSVTTTASSGPTDEWIFLSHSGKQKDFVTHLNKELIHAKHRPFFDKDKVHSLPIGRDYPPRILQVCQSCKMGVVVLTEDYVKSLWPMLELQHLLHPSSPDRLIYPLFYELNPGDLSDPNKLKEWGKCWQEKYTARWKGKVQNLQQRITSSGLDLQINLDIKSWPENLGILQGKSGHVRQVFHVINSERSLKASDDEYIGTIVSTICAVLPPPREYSLEVGIMGEERMQQEIGQLFQNTASMGGDGASTIGVHGIGGSGKSILCKMMANFYRNNFPGRCFYMQFPTIRRDSDDTAKVLLKNIKTILLRLACAAQDVSDIDQAMHVLEMGLQRYETFLAIDNVWDASFGYARKIMQMECMPGTKIMVTSRSKKIVSDLIKSRPGMNDREIIIVHVPSLTKEEAAQVLKSYSCCSSAIPAKHFEKLALSTCFFEEYYHPLCLKLKGGQLHKRGESTFTEEEWSNLISRLEGVKNCIDVQDSSNRIISYSESTVLDKVKESFDVLEPDLQNIFIDLVTFQSNYDLPVWTYIRLHYDGFTEDDMFSQVRRLVHHGLLELEYDKEAGEYRRLLIHDLHTQMIKDRMDSLPNVNHALVKSAIRHERDLSLFKKNRIMRNYKHVSGDLSTTTDTWKALFGSRTKTSKHTDQPCQVEIRYLSLNSSIESESSASPERIHLMKNERRNLEALRVLELQNFEYVIEITGWEGIPNLVWLILTGLKGLKSIEPLDSLKSLEKLCLRHCDNLELQSLVGGAEDRSGQTLVKASGHLGKLQELTIQTNCHLAAVGPLSGAFPALKKLELTECRNLKCISDLNSLSRLLILDLDGCTELSIVEGSVSSLTALRELDLRKCRNLQLVPDLGNLLSLRKLDAWECPSLKLMPTNCHEYLESGSSDDSLGGSVIHVEEETSNRESRCTAGVLSLLREAILCDRHNLIRSAPFMHLRHLSLEVARYPASTTNIRLLDIDVSDVPCLEELRLAGFEVVQKLTFPPSLVKLQSLTLRNFPSLEEISGLGAQHLQLWCITIEECPLLVRFLHGDAKHSLAGLTSLRKLSIKECNSLTDLSSVAALPASTDLQLDTILTSRIPDLTHFTAQENIGITGSSTASLGQCAKELQ